MASGQVSALLGFAQLVLDSSEVGAFVVVGLGGDEVSDLGDAVSEADALVDGEVVEAVGVSAFHEAGVVHVLVVRRQVVESLSHHVARGQGSGL